ncbi:MAG TPA: DUF3293 domain-containing protein [Rhodanobacteraceae bacterium]|nr:DUF3293 domain-containing protein [Rhodanobacteraceae bacterium]
MSAIETEAVRIHALLALYRESHYDVELARGRIATLRVGEPAPAAVLRWMGGDRSAFYITSCNPHSQSLPREENEQRLESLRARLRQGGHSFLEGAGHIPGEAWREQCLLVRGIVESDVTALVQTYEQNSIVVVRAKLPTVLRVYRSDWRDLIGESADVEWA